MVDVSPWLRASTPPTKPLSTGVGNADPFLTYDQVYALVGPRKYTYLTCAKCGKGRPEVEPIYGVAYGSMVSNGLPTLCHACYNLWLLYAAMFFPDPR